jgi:hypothetical protein
MVSMFVEWGRWSIKPIVITVFLCSSRAVRKHCASMQELRCDRVTIDPTRSAGSQ